MMRAAVGIVAVAMLLPFGSEVVACASSPRPHPQDPQLTGFPDLSGYSADNPNDYDLSVPNGGLPPLRFVYFTTPDGVLCTFIEPDYAQCWGANIPGIPKDQRSPDDVIATNANLHKSDDDPYPGGLVQGQKARTLPPFHSLTMYGVICGVDDSGMTACKGPPGTGAFVLSPQGDRWMPL